LARSGPRSEPTVYELVKIDGSFRRSDMAPRGQKTSTFPSTLQLMRRSRGREDIMPLHTISGNDIVLIAIARIVRPPAINRTVEANRLEYKTRHLIDGRIIDCDQRISLVAGYMTDEVRNLSPFTFMHQDDAFYVLIQTLTLVSDDDGDSEASSSNSVTPHGSHHHYSAQQHSSKPYFSGSSPQLVGSAMSSVGRSSKTPPLALVPPAADSIKNSITKSVSVVKTTAAKFLRSHSNCQPQAVTTHENHRQNTVEGSHIGCFDDESDNIVASHHADSDMYATHRDQETERHAFTSTGAVKRKISCSISDIDSDEYRVPMQRQAIENVLSSSLQQINNRLNQQLNTAMELRDQGQRYEVPHTEERLAELW
ncbi:hypothetical protein DOY81_010537, partial [Sarcophaga bullata]